MNLRDIPIQTSGPARARRLAAVVSVTALLILTATGAMPGSADASTVTSGPLKVYTPPCTAGVPSCYPETIIAGCAPNTPSPPVAGYTYEDYPVSYLVAQGVRLLWVDFTYTATWQVTPSNPTGIVDHIRTPDGTGTNTTNLTTCDGPGTYGVHILAADANTSAMYTLDTTLTLTLVPTSLTLSGPTSVHRAAAATLSGVMQLGPGSAGAAYSPAGETVLLYYKARGRTAFSLVATMLASATGTYTTKIKLYRSGYFYVSHPVSYLYAASVSPTRYVAVKWRPPRERNLGRAGFAEWDRRANAGTTLAAA
jgi:hypothetical protein